MIWESLFSFSWSIHTRYINRREAMSEGGYMYVWGIRAEFTFANVFAPVLLQAIICT